jgi:hypothetical protein
MVMLVLVTAGCGGSAGPDRSASRDLPRALASAWSGEASAVAAASASGDDCHALQLAGALRDEVIGNESKVPSRLRSQLLAAVNELADRIVCQAPPRTVTVPPKNPPKPKPPHEKDHHDPRHHHHAPDNQG